MAEAEEFFIAAPCMLAEAFIQKIRRMQKVPNFLSFLCILSNYAFVKYVICIKIKQNENETTFKNRYKFIFINYHDSKIQ